ncbi:MAG: hypothetical protein ABI615_08845 [Chthoniobacterales bacterium]
MHLVKPQNSKYWHGRFKLPDETKWRDVSLRCTNKQVAYKRLHTHYDELEREAAGILAPKTLRDAAQKLLTEHAADMIALKSANRSAQYLREFQSKITRLSNECGWEIASNITPESFQSWRLDLIESGEVSPRRSTNI